MFCGHFYQRENYSPKQSLYLIFQQKNKLSQHIKNTYGNWQI